jgi:hypothetical protein
MVEKLMVFDFVFVNEDVKVFSPTFSADDIMK